MSTKKNPTKTTNYVEINVCQHLTIPHMSHCQATLLTHLLVVQELLALLILISALGDTWVDAGMLSTG